MEANMDNFERFNVASISQEVDKVCRWLFHKRKMRVFGMGLPKTGTTSLAAMLAKVGRSSHEALAKFMLPHICSYLRGDITEASIRRKLRYRAMLLRVDIDVTSFLHHFIDILSEMYPDAKFIFTIRNCYSWVRSIINHMDTRYTAPSSPWLAYRDIRFGYYGEKYCAEEEILSEKGLYPVASFLRHWNEANIKALYLLPPDRSMVLKTEDLSNATSKLAAFLSIDPSVIQLRRENKAPRYGKATADVPSEFIISQCERYCSDLMTKLYGTNWISSLT